MFRISAQLVSFCGAGVRRCKRKLSCKVVHRRVSSVPAFVSPVTIGLEAFSSVLERKINDASIELFDQFEPGEINIFLQVATHLEIPEQTTIVRQDHLGEELFVILGGIAEFVATMRMGRSEF